MLHKKQLNYYSGSCADDTPNSLGVAQFAVELKASEPRDFTDEWRFGITVFLNPNANIPLHEDYFDSVTRGKYSNEEGFLRKMLSFHPYNAKNLRVNTVTKGEEELSQKLRAWFERRTKKQGYWYAGQSEIGQRVIVHRNDTRVF